MSWALQIFIQALIVYSIITTALETMPEMAEHARFFFLSETIVVAIFSIEYLWHWRNAKHRWRYPLTGMAIIDLLAILPYYLGLFLAGVPSFVPLRGLRLLRIFRLLKLARYSRSLQMLGEAVRRSGPELIVFLFLAAIIVVISAMGLYYAEHEAQPDVYRSIPDSIWWAIVTLTTVGYGDVYPTTTAGRMIASIVMLTGIGFIAVPTSLISSTMTEIAVENRLRRQEEKEAEERKKLEAKELAQTGTPPKRQEL